MPHCLFWEELLKSLKRDVWNLRWEGSKPQHASGGQQPRSAEQGPGPAWRWDRSSLQSVREHRQDMRPAGCSHSGWAEVETCSILRDSTESPPICKNLALNVSKCLLKTAFYKLRQRQEGRMGLEESLGRSVSHRQLVFPLLSFNSRRKFFSFLLFKFTFIIGFWWHMEIRVPWWGSAGSPFQALMERKKAQPSNLLFPLQLLLFIFWEGSRMVGGIDIPVDRSTWTKRPYTPFSFSYLIAYTFFQLQNLRLIWQI